MKRSRSFTLIFFLILLVLGLHSFMPIPFAKADGKLDLSYVPGELIVAFYPDVTPQALADFYGEYYQRYDVILKDNLDSNRKDTHPEEKLVSIPKGQGKAMIAIMEKDTRVKYVEYNYIYTLDALPNDPRFGELWGLDNAGQTGGIPGADINAIEAWDLTTGSSDIIIGVIDSGIDYAHEDLAANLWTNPGEIPGNGIDDDANGYIDDIHGINAILNTGDPFDDFGHGSHVAGTCCAVDNAVGIVGVSQKVRIAACKFGAADNTGTAADAVKCFKYFNHLKNVQGQNIRVTNNSWGGDPFSQAIRDAMAGLDQPGMVPILHMVAAGNGSRDIDQTPFYPASFDLNNILTVASTDHNDNYASSTNFGSISVDIAAPGVSILSTLPTGACPLCTPSGYGLLTGTSMATPHVTGGAGLLWAQDPTLTLDEIKTRLIFFADPLSGQSTPTVSNNRLNIFTALGPPPLSPPTIISTPVTEATLGQPYSYQATATGDQPITWSLLSGPAGITVNSNTGLVSWTPDAQGSFIVQIQASNADGNDTQSFTVTVTTVPSQTTTLLQLTEGWNDDRGKTLTSEGDLGVVQQSDNIRLRVRVNTFVSFEFDQSIPTDSTILSAKIFVEHNESSGFSSNALLWEVGGGLLTNPTVFQTLVPPVLIGNANESVVEWDVSATVNTPAKANDLKFVFHNNGNERAWIDHIFVEIVHTAAASSSPQPPIITSSGITTGEVGQLYTYQATASGDQPITWSLPSAPAGMTINATGLVEWTPNAAGSFGVQIQASNTSGSDSQAYTIGVSEPPPAPQPPIITSSGITTGEVGQLYTYQATASGDQPITWSLPSAPAGMTINATGLVEWTPNAAGSFSVQIQASNTSGSDSQAYTVTVSEAPLPGSDTVTIDRAEYRDKGKKNQLRVKATSTSDTATLEVFVTATGEFIGTLNNKGGGSYEGRFTWPVNPQNITVNSSLGGTDSAGV